MQYVEKERSRLKPPGCLILNAYQLFFYFVINLNTLSAKIISAPIMNVMLSGTLFAGKVTELDEKLLLAFSSLSKVQN